MMLSMKAFCLLGSASSRAPRKAPVTAAAWSVAGGLPEAGELPVGLAGDAHRRVVARLGAALRAVVLHPDAPRRLAELRGGEADVHVARVGEDAVEVAPAVALVRASGAPAGADRLHRVALQEPVRDVDDVDVLLHDDVAGEGLVVHPVAQAALRGARVRPVGPVDRRGEVVDLPRDGLADLALVDPLRRARRRARRGGSGSPPPGSPSPSPARRAPSPSCTPARPPRPASRGRCACPRRSRPRGGRGGSTAGEAM